MICKVQDTVSSISFESASVISQDTKHKDLTTPKSWVRKNDQNGGFSSIVRTTVYLKWCGIHLNVQL